MPQPNTVKSLTETHDRLECLRVKVAALSTDTIAEFIARQGDKVWAVATSGHGSSYTFGPEVLIPDLSACKTLAEAKDEAKEWRALSDTIGGDALVVHMPTYLQRIIDVPGEHPLHGVQRGQTENILRAVEHRHSSK